MHVLDPKMLRRWLAVFAIAFVPAAASAEGPARADQAAALPVSATSMSLGMKYHAYVGGLTVATAEVDVTEAADGYTIAMDILPDGVVGWFTDFRLSSVSESERVGDAFRPRRYLKSYWKKGRKRSELEIAYRDGKVSELRQVPPPKPGERPQVPERLRESASDPITAALLAVAPGLADGACEGSFKVYDGSRLFGIAMSRDGARWLKTRLSGGPKRLQATVCRIKIEPLAGFERDELREGHYPRSATAYLAQPAADLPRVPVRLDAKSSIGAVRIHLVDLR